MGHHLSHPLGQTELMQTRRFPPSGPTTSYRLTVPPPLTVEFRSITYHIEFCYEEPSGRHELIAREDQRCSHWKMGPTFRTHEALADATLRTGFPIQSDTVPGTIIRRLISQGRAVAVDVRVSHTT